MLTAKDEGTERIIIPAGTHVARCIGIIDLGTQYSEKFGNSNRKVLIKWELPNELMEDGRPVGASKKYTLSLNDKANLKKDLENWLGRGVTEQEQKEGFALGALLGLPCLLSVIHAQSGDKTYANVAGVMSVPKGTQVPPQSNPMVSYDVENGKDATFEKLPEWVRKIIEQSDEFRGDLEAKTEEIPSETPDNPAPFEFEEPLPEPKPEPESYLYNGKTYTREGWLLRLHQACTGRFIEPTDMDSLTHDDLQAAGNVIIKQYFALAEMARIEEKKRAAAERRVT